MELYTLYYIKESVYQLYLSLNFQDLLGTWFHALEPCLTDNSKASTQEPKSIFNLRMCQSKQKPNKDVKNFNISSDLTKLGRLSRRDYSL